MDVAPSYKRAVVFARGGVADDTLPRLPQGNGRYPPGVNLNN